LTSAPGGQDHTISPSHRSVRPHELYLGMIFFGKPLRTFPDHAVMLQTNAPTASQAQRS